MTNPLTSITNAQPQLALAAFYGRVSTDHQENSLEVQITKARAYAITKNLQIPDHYIFQDSDTSGSKPLEQRDGGQLLLNTIKLNHRLANTTHPEWQSRPGSDPSSSAPSAVSFSAPSGQEWPVRQGPPPASRISHLIITKVDRLGRNLLDFETQTRWFREQNITLHIIDFGGDSMTTAGHIGRLFLQMMAAFAEFEREMIRSRTAQVLEHKRERHQLTNGTVPFGWDLVPDTKTITPNPGEQAIILKMRHWRSEIGWSYHRIAQELNQSGIHTKTGRGLWQSGNVAKVLRNKTVTQFLTQLQHQQAA